MVGRGAIGKPWIFQLMKNYIDGNKETEPTKELISKVVLEHFDPDDSTFWRLWSYYF